jgi:hybrid cluster-associated redox disulfide protein
MAKKFTKDMLLVDVLKAHKDASKVLRHFGVKCSACSGKAQETLKTGAMNHGLDITEVLSELNKLK